MSRHRKVRASRFYGEYHGHRVSHLEALYPELRERNDSLVWTAGDSSLDNKYWFTDERPAVGAYGDVLEPPTSNADVTYWMNYIVAHERQSNHKRGAINTAVEASTLNERTFRLRPQDRFLRDNIAESDVLVVSVGGNDVAMCPMPCTICSILSLVSMPTWCLEKSCVLGTVPVDDCCCGCGASLCSCGCACPPCSGYMVHMFGTRVQKYIEQLTSKTKPKKILVCMIYYLDENTVPSWAGGALGALGYNSDPAKLQLMIRRVFVEATSKIKIPGSEVVPAPLYLALDGKNSNDYIARVEPSSQGGRKLAEFILDLIDSPYAHAGSATPVESHYMAQR